MIYELEELLAEGKILILISGQSIANILQRVIQFIDKKLLKGVLVGHCNGSELYGFDSSGELIQEPYFSILDDYKGEFNHKKWRCVVNCIMEEYGIKPLPFMDIDEFKRKTGGDPRFVMYDDRKVQISIDFVNGLSLKDFPTGSDIYALNENIDDIRIPIIRKAKLLFQKECLQIEPHSSGAFAIDFNIKGVTKGLLLSRIFAGDEQYRKKVLKEVIVSNHNEIEVWGDSFSVSSDGSDQYMSTALPKESRSISFRKISPEDLLKDYNIVVWNGVHSCHEGLLEYLKTRKVR
ncbi:MAG: hypothetical protein N3I35_18600 [Clostridia bacterium]|nr:hypothetical protein [Clostridia bacterium]